MKKKDFKKLLKKIWYFIWEDNSAWSWIVNVIIAFILIKFIVYPGLGFFLSTTHPVVAVVSSSMEHNTVISCGNNGNGLFNGDDCESYDHKICGNTYDTKNGLNFDEYWRECGSWYKDLGIIKDEFQGFPFRNGFNKGDIMVLAGKAADKIKIGDVIVFRSNNQDPIIHRVVKKNEMTFHTKGDNNADSIKTSALDETQIVKNAIIGKAVFRIPLLGYIKILFVDYVVNPYCAITDNAIPCGK
jgi:hypothetical protein